MRAHDDQVCGQLSRLLDDGAPAEILPLLHELQDYDLVLFGTPVWAGHVSSPVRACLDAQRNSLRRVAFFCTQILGFLEQGSP